MHAVVYVNGTIADAKHATVPVFDHGFLYGEGVYETLRTYHLEPFLFDRHMKRLRHSAELMALDVPYTDDGMLALVNETMTAAKAGKGDEAYIRILLTRGVGELTYNPSATPTPTLVIIVKPFTGPAPQTFVDGIKISLVHVRRNHPHALNPMIKSNNLLNNALAMQEAYRHGAEEALMQNQQGELVECSQSNVFIVKNGVVLTPPISAGLLPGITRAYTMELAHEIGLQAREAHVTPADGFAADEMFLTGTTREVTPVIAIDDSPIGNGKPGPITQKLYEAFRSRVSKR